MSGVYTNIAKKRAEQSRNSVGVAEQRPPIPTPAPEPHPKSQESRPLPVSPPLQQPVSNTLSPKKQISAYLTLPQHTLFKQLYHKLNTTDANVDKSEIVGLALEVLSALISDETPNFPTLVRLKEYLLAKVTKT